LQAALRYRPDVVFLGRRPPQELGSLLALVDVAVSPHPILEGDFYFCPLKVLEYAAAGCAVVASAQGDVPRLLDLGRVGVALSDPNLQAWYTAIVGLLDDPERAAFLGREARAWVHDHYTWRHAALQVEHVLRSSIVSNPSGRK